MANSEVYKAHKFIKDFDFEIKRYLDSLQTIDLKFGNAVRNDEFVEFEAIRKEANQLQIDFAESQLFIEYTKYITLLAPTINGGLNVSRDLNEDAQHLKKYIERITKEIEDIKQKELDQKLREERDKLVIETKDRIKQLEDTIAEEAKTKAQLVEKNKTLESDIEKQAEELKNANDLYEQQKKDSDAKDQILLDNNA